MGNYNRASHLVGMFMRLRRVSDFFVLLWVGGGRAWLVGWYAGMVGPVVGLLVDPLLSISLVVLGETWLSYFHLAGVSGIWQIVFHLLVDGLLFGYDLPGGVGSVGGSSVDCKREYCGASGWGLLGFSINFVLWACSSSIRVLYPVNNVFKISKPSAISSSSHPISTKRVLSHSCIYLWLFHLC